MNTNQKIERIAVVADENKRTSLIEWSYFNRDILNRYEVIANETTADLLRGTLNSPITVLADDPLDGYRELAKLVQNKEVEILIFFGSLFKEDIHQSGLKDLIVLANGQNIVTACNPATANLIIKALGADVQLPEDTEPFRPKNGNYESEPGSYYTPVERGDCVAH